MAAEGLLRQEVDRLISTYQGPSPMTVFLRLEDVREIHRQVIEATGGLASFGGALLYLDLA